MANISPYYQNLLKQVVENSESNNWASAVSEWEIVDVEEDDERLESCVCGKEYLRYLYTIENRLNGNILYPIGSQCIRKFGREDLADEINVKEQMFKLLHAVEENQFLTLSSDFFSRKLLLYLFEQGAFKETKYNGFDSSKDYYFMLDMFNKRARTPNQEKKATAIILNSIKPFLQEELEGKIKNRR